MEYDKLYAVSGSGSLSKEAASGSGSGRGMQHETAAYFTQEQILLKICKFKEEQEKWKMYTLWSTR
ncbi:MAG: hypothetical protein ACLR6B_06565 [Blautia sp.]